MTRIMISLPEKMLENIDKIAKEESRTRSELIRESFRTYIEMIHKERLNR